MRDYARIGEMHFAIMGTGDFVCEFGITADDI